MSDNQDVVYEQEVYIKLSLSCTRKQLNIDTVEIRQLPSEVFLSMIPDFIVDNNEHYISVMILDYSCTMPMLRNFQ